MAADPGLYDHLLKILIIGDTGVGKSCLMLRFTDDLFNEKQLATIGVDFKVKYVQERGLGGAAKAVKLALWDTAGQERFRTLTASYYRNAQGIVVVYDVSNKDTFRNIKQWLQEVRQHSTHENAVLMLIANKVDLPSREVSREEGQSFAEEHNMLYIETSAKTRLQVETAFRDLVKKILLDPVLLEGTGPAGSGGGGSSGGAGGRRLVEGEFGENAVGRENCSC